MIDLLNEVLSEPAAGPSLYDEAAWRVNQLTNVFASTDAASSPACGDHATVARDAADLRARHGSPYRPVESAGRSGPTHPDTDLDKAREDPERIDPYLEAAADLRRAALESAPGRDRLGASHRRNVRHFPGRTTQRRHPEDSDPEHRDGDDRFCKAEPTAGAAFLENRVQEPDHSERAETCGLSGDFGALSVHNAANSVRILPTISHGAWYASTRNRPRKFETMRTTRSPR